jgi:hypothetical protein
LPSGLDFTADRGFVNQLNARGTVTSVNFQESWDSQALPGREMQGPADFGWSLSSSSSCCSENGQVTRTELLPE